MCGGIGERINNFELLDDRARPAMRDDERQRILVLRADVDEMNVESVDLRDELRIRVQLRLALSPVVLHRPIASKRLRRRQLNALRRVRDRLVFGPFRRFDAPTQIGELVVCELHPKRTNVGVLLTAHFEFGNRTGHGVNSPGGTEKTKLARGNGCRGRSDKATAIDVGCV